MKKLISLLGSKEFHLLFIYACFVFFTYPLFILSPHNPGKIFISFFMPWGMVIIILFLMSRHYKCHQQDSCKEKKDV